MDDTLLEDLAGSTRDLFAAGDGTVTVESLVEFGWNELLDDSPAEAVSSLFTETGSVAGASGALDLILHSYLELGDDQPVTAARLVTDPHSWAPGDHVDFEAILLSARSSDATRVIAIHPPSGIVALLALDFGASVEISPIVGVDPARHLQRLRATAAPLVEILDSVRASSVSALTMVAVGYEQLGAARRIVSVAAEHVQSRRQFGRPIGSYQAVQHRLAEALVACEAAVAALDASWTANDDVAAPIAALLAGQAAEAALTHGLQVCGGMGFTEEFTFAPHVRRVTLLGDLLWSTDQLAKAIAARLVVADRLPRLAASATDNLLAKGA